ncbi:DUF1330 domain-containing protein [Castellaniella sp. GW247-6E4]|uniref:DUF1330 domain-containing protein n=1 Tax=Castellaniella sp. GW247-6E4 TaxID=3140380 RepID=UPI00331617C9
MSAYIIVNVEVTDPEQYKQYQKFSSEAMSKYGARVLVRGGEVTSLEGALPGRTVVMEFDDVEAARRFYDSPEYRQGRKARADAARVTMYIVQGV